MRCAPSVTRFAVECSKGRASYISGTAWKIYTKGKFMLHSIKLLYGDKLGASDGHIGHVKDLYFDDKHWVVRYVVADTGSWLPGRQVLISPHAFGSLPQAGKVLRVNLTRKQI